MNYNDIATLILDRKRKHKPFLVAIDGKSCAGKTTFTDSLGQTIKTIYPTASILRPSIDGFHHPRAYRYRQGELSAKGYYEDTYDVEKIIEGLLKPLKNGPYPVECISAAHDVRTDQPIQETVTANQNTILFFEGLFTMKSPLDKFWDYMILLDITDAMSLQRAKVRDLDLLGDVDTITQKYEQRYTPAWHMYDDEINPHKKADLVINNNTLPISSEIRYIKRHDRTSRIIQTP